MEANLIYRMNLFTTKGTGQVVCPRKEGVMNRYHQEKERIKRAHREHLRTIHGWPKEAVTCICDLQAGRFRKKKPLGCQKRRCFCKYEKIFKRPTVKDRIRKYRFKDSLNDCFDQ